MNDLGATALTGRRSCVSGAHTRSKIKDGAHTLYARKRAYRGQTGLTAMKPVMADEEVSIRDSDGRSYSGSREMRGTFFVLVNEQW